MMIRHNDKDAKYKKIINMKVHYHTNAEMVEKLSIKKNSWEFDVADS